MKKLKKIRKITLAVFNFLLAFLLIGYAIAMDNFPTVTRALGQTSSEISGSSDEAYYESDYDNLAALIEDTKVVAEEVIEGGSVLLKNDTVGNEPALPLAKGSNISLFSLSSVDPVYGGTGSGHVNTDLAPTFKSALERNDNFNVNGDLWEYYYSVKDTYQRTFGSIYDAGGEPLAGVSGVNFNGDVPWDTLINGTNVNGSLQTYGDAAIFILSRVGGEGSDLLSEGFSINNPGDATDGDYLRLSPKEASVLEGLKAKKDDGTISKIILLINSANMVSGDFIDDDAYGIDAAMWIGTPGQVGLYGVADLLVGDVNPSGRLADVIWYDNQENPVLSNFGAYVYDGTLPDDISDYMNNSGTYVVYQEGIYLGYRYTETRYEDFVLGADNVGNYNYDQTVQYPFGYGLSYTNFEYSNFTVSAYDEVNHTYDVSVDVENVGSVAGREVVQIYLQKPYIEGGIEKPSVELVGYDKTALLAPNESETVTVTVDEKYFASYDANDQLTYVLDKGDYYLTVAKNSHDAVNNILAAKGKTVLDGMDSDGNALLTNVLDYSGITDQRVLKYSTTENGVDITNLFDQSDMNKYDGRGDNSVEYMTRSNWNGTTKQTVSLTWTPQMTIDLAAKGYGGQMTLEQDDIAYPTYGANRTTDRNGNEVANIKLISLLEDENGNPIAYDDPRWDDLLDQLTWDETVELIRSGMRRTASIAAIAKPETLDHNGPQGLTERFGNFDRGLAALTDDPLKNTNAMNYPSSPVLASSFDDELAARVGNLMGEEALWAGYSGLYGPGSNIHRSPYSGRNFEYYSEDAFLSGKISAQAIAGMESHGMYVYNKHFAGNDQEYNRMGISVWTNEQAFREIYLRAFELPIAEGNASNVMAAYSRLGMVWSGAHKGLMTDLLRNEWNMRGFVITDMWYGQANHMNLPSMLMAGTNIVDGSRPTSDLDMAKDGGYGELAWAMRESAHRILYTVLHSNAMNGYSLNTEITDVMPPWQIELLAVLGLVGIAFVGNLSWMIVDEIKDRKKLNLK